MFNNTQGEKNNIGDSLALAPITLVEMDESKTNDCAIFSSNDNRSLNQLCGIYFN